MKTLLLNDCSHYHSGSLLVTKMLYRYMRQCGMERVEDADEAQLLIINGEGTMHHDAPRSRELLAQCATRRADQRVVLLNSTWQSMTPPPGLSLAVARESLSEQEMRQGGIAPEIRRLPDLSLTSKHRPDYVGGSGLMVIDSVWPAETAWLKEIAREMGGRMIYLCEDKREPEAIMDELATADLVLTGRFHGIMFAALAGAPFLAARSNSHKTPGFLADYDLQEALVTNAAEARAKLPSGGVRFDRRLLPGIQAAWQACFESLHQCQPIPVPLPMAEAPARLETPVVPKAKAVLSCPAHVWSRPKSIVLVGNGPSLLGKGLGDIIDAHDEVVRFNEFALAGHEADVGTRVTFWSTCSKSLRPASGELPARVICVHGDTKLAHETREVLRVPAAFYKRLTAEIRAISKHAHASDVRPTSGFIVARWLLESGCPRIHLAGFDHFRKHESRQHHYWQARAYGRPFEHDGDAEAELLSPYATDRRVIYLT